MTYVVTIKIAYEGSFSEYFNTLDEVRKFINAHGYSWDDITIIENPKYIDVYTLMEGHSK